ncbi:probable serine hydrolase isoform X1 [Diprion similis]|uniref:probable serine hydrolase isoform X1 n=1 Tax=Diprion similis TaxID=362088 RepID=UPI001EF8E906|nr:probable serine hydrolase isoform X1 [Diprion similis]
MLSQIYSRKIIQHVAAGARNFYRNSYDSNQDATEVEIPVPWGKIAGKWWGPKDRQPILAFHGWQDNAATFDTLIPFLPKGTSVLAMDMPGHGYSSWLPAGIPYSLMNTVLLVKRIVKYYDWRKVKFMGHSMGSMVVFLYASYFPQEMDFGIGIDLVKPPSIDVNKYSKIIAEHAENILRIEARTTDPPTYGDEEIMHKWIKGTQYSLDEAACRLLMKRGVKEVGKGEFIFSKDPRLITYTSFDSGYTHDHILKLAEQITCPYRLIKASDSPFYQDKNLVLETVEKMSINSSDFAYTVVPGKHHLHLTHPERVTEILNPFLEKHNK